MTDSEFEVEFGRFAAFYNWEPNEIQVEIWWQEFEAETAARFRAGVDILCRNWRPEYGIRHPHPQDLREALPPLASATPRAPRRTPEEEARGMRLLRVILDRFEGKIDDAEMKRRMAAEGVEVGHA